MKFKTVRHIILLLKTLLAGAMALIILSLFTFPYGYSGIHITNYSGATDYTWEPHQWKTTMSEGTAWIQMDENGFNNAYPATENINILLMGSSHMEAVNVAETENVGYILNQRIPDYSTYNIGISGHTIYNCVNNIENALAEYTPSNYVLLETSTIRLDEAKMEEVIAGSYPHIKSYDTGILYWMQRALPAVKSIYNQVSNWRDVCVEMSKDIVEVASSVGITETYKAALNEFLSEFADAAHNHGITPLIFYQPAMTIDENGALRRTSDAEYLTVFAEICGKLGIIFVDMTDDFQLLYEEDCVLAHGFVNTAVGSGHLNTAGHRLIAERIAAVIEEVEQYGIA